MYVLKELQKDMQDSEWQEYFAFRQECAEKNVPLNFKTWQTLKSKTLENLSDGYYISLVFKHNQPFGYFLLQPMFKDDLDKKYISFINCLINQKLDKTLLKSIFNIAFTLDNHLNYILIGSKDGTNDFLKQSLDATVAETLLYSDLKIEDANIDVIDKWYEEGSVKFKHLSLKFFELLPEHLFEEYANVFTLLLDDMPYNKDLRAYKVTSNYIKTRQEKGIQNNSYVYRYVVFNDQDKIVAMTNVIVDKDKPTSVHQIMTGSLIPYRGIGIGKWLKAAMFKKLVSDFPKLEVIKTDANATNTASIQLSKKMGFKQVSDYKELIVKKEKMKQFLDLN